MSPRSRAAGALLAVAAPAAAFTTPPAASAQDAIPWAGTAPLVWAECQPGQVEVMILGTFHFAQSSDVGVLEAVHQRDLDLLLDALAAWGPDRVAVEFPHARQAELSEAYATYVASGEDVITSSKNEIHQIGFRLGRRLGHPEMYAIDVPMNLWHDSIQVFDDRWPEAREGLRARWSGRHAERPEPEDATLLERLAALNRDEPPGNSEMYAGFLPLLEDEVYAGALKLRPWYDRNLRIIQNLFRIADPEDERLLLVIGAGHLRVLKQILEMTPQMCPVSALGPLEGQVETGTR